MECGHVCVVDLVSLPCHFRAPTGRTDLMRVVLSCRRYPAPYPVPQSDWDLPSVVLLTSGSMGPMNKTLKNKIKINSKDTSTSGLCVPALIKICTYYTYIARYMLIQTIGTPLYTETYTYSYVAIQKTTAVRAS